MTGEIVGDHLSHFTQIALMLIAFGIGEHLDLSRLRHILKSIGIFEPPIYVLFFTLAGTQLHLSALFLAGWIGLAYFFFRVFGKMAGSFVGAFLANSPSAVQKYLGFALVPQAGVAIGLIFLIKEDPQLSVFPLLLHQWCLQASSCPRLSVLYLPGSQ